jgi:hypothetical protein
MVGHLHDGGAPSLVIACQISTRSRGVTMAWSDKTRREGEHRMRHAYGMPERCRAVGGTFVVVVGARYSVSRAPARVQFVHHLIPEVALP